jgi:VWFA-related protein
MQGRLSCAALVAVAAAALGAAAQEPRQPTFRLEANYVRVDLYARHGDKAIEDLRAEEIDLLEDGVPQTIQAFEHVTIRSSISPELRRDPASPSQSRAIAEDPRVRILVIFLDTFHVQIDGSHNMRKPLIEMMERTVGDEDLVGVMHPRMSARDLTLGRKISVISEGLTENWIWGERHRDTPLDPVEEQWFYCYGPGPRFDEMRARRRETMSLDALSDLVTHLRGLREERKAVLLVSEGWRLFGENRKLAEPEKGEAPPSGPGIFVGPTGKIQSRDSRTQGGASKSDCDTQRMELAFTDNTRRLRDLMGEANRANVTFYPVYPGGLQVADAPLVTQTSAAGMESSMRRLTSSLNQLRELATNTDGLAVVNTNDISGAMRRIVSDLTSYYLLGYYSTNTKPDGKFRSITVRVKRPGVQVRARRGYRALTAEEAETLRAATTAHPARAAPPAPAAAHGILQRPDGRVNPDNLASLRHVVLWKRSPSTGREYVPTNDPRLRRTERLRLEHATNTEGLATARMLDGTGKPMAVPVQMSERPDPSGSYRWLVADVALAPLAPGDYAIELTLDERKVVTAFKVVP